MRKKPFIFYQIPKLGLNLVWFKNIYTEINALTEKYCLINEICFRFTRFVSSWPLSLLFHWPLSVCSVREVERPCALSEWSTNSGLESGHHQHSSLRWRRLHLSDQYFPIWQLWHRVVPHRVEWVHPSYIWFNWSLLFRYRQYCAKVLRMCEKNSNQHKFL